MYLVIHVGVNDMEMMSEADSNDITDTECSHDDRPSDGMFATFLLSSYFFCVLCFKFFHIFSILICYISVSKMNVILCYLRNFVFIVLNVNHAGPVLANWRPCSNCA